MVVLVIGVVGSATAQLYGDTAQPNLATECISMGLEVNVQGDSENSERDEQLQVSLQNLVESRMRSARLYAEDGWDKHWQYLSVNVVSVNVASTLSLYPYRSLWDTGYGKGTP